MWGGSDGGHGTLTRTRGYPVSGGGSKPPLPRTHFVGFRGEEYFSAVRVWGLPDFYHRNTDRRMWSDVIEGDTVVFANGFEKKFYPFAFNDSEHF